MQKLFAKLILVQRDMKAITKSETNPFHKSKYFDISGLLAKLKPVLTTHGVVVIQPIDVVDGALVLRTVVSDTESGESYASMMTLPVGIKAQELGAAISYYRRYALTSFFALEGEDEDGNNTPAPNNEEKSSAFESAHKSWKKSIKEGVADSDKNALRERILSSPMLTETEKNLIFLK